MLEDPLSCTVIVQETMDTLITAHRIEGFGDIGRRVQSHVVLCSEFGHIRSSLETQGQKRKMVWRYICFSSAPYINLELMRVDSPGLLIMKKRKVIKHRGVAVFCVKKHLSEHDFEEVFLDAGGGKSVTAG